MIDEKGFQHLINWVKLGNKARRLIFNALTRGPVVHLSEEDKREIKNGLKAVADCLNRGELIVSVRIKDVAEKAGVSTATVSRVLSDKEGVGEETKARIKRLMKEMGYRPNTSARGLAKQEIGSIGIVTSRKGNIVFGNPFFTKIFEGVSNALDKENFNMVFTFTYQQQKNLLEQHSVDGVILFAARNDDSIVTALKDSSLPTVVAGNFSDPNLFPVVAPDDKDGVYSAVAHLIENGHQYIELVNGPLSSHKSLLCQEGYKEACKDLLPHDYSNVINVNEYDSTASYEAFKKRIREYDKPMPTAIVCSSDYLAFGVLKVAQERNINIPEDLSVIGFGNVPFSEFTCPPLTTMHTNLEKIGEQSANMLLSKIRGRQIRKRYRQFPFKIIERGTVKNLNIRN